MAKLDKIKFAQVVAMVASEYKYVHNDFIEALDRAIDIEQPEQERVYPMNNHIDELMKLMVEGQRKIEAIKVHRAITGMGLKDSKDAVERYWISKPIIEKND